MIHTVDAKSNSAENMLLDKDINMWEENNQYMETLLQKRHKISTEKHKNKTDGNMLDKSTPMKICTSKY